MRFSKVAVLAVVMLVVTGGALQAAAPKLLSYQGRLEDGAGDAVVDGNYQISFAIFEAATSGVAAWGETHADRQNWRG